MKGSPSSGTLVKNILIFIEKKVKIFSKSLEFILFAMNEFSHSTYLNTPSGDPKSQILAKFVHFEAFFLSPERGCLKSLTF